MPDDDSALQLLLTTDPALLAIVRLSLVAIGLGAWGLRRAGERCAAG
jgi:hypothetical protein